MVSSCSSRQTNSHANPTTANSLTSGPSRDQIQSIEIGTGENTSQGPKYSKNENIWLLWLVLLEHFSQRVWAVLLLLSGAAGGQRWQTERQLWDVSDGTKTFIMSLFEWQIVHDNAQKQEKKRIFAHWIMNYLQIFVPCFMFKKAD